MIHIRWKAVNAYQANQQTSLNPIASPEPGSRMGLKRNRVERRYKFMKCKRLSAWLLSLVMMFSLLPVSAAAVKWYDKHSVTVKYEFKDDSSNSKPDDVKRTIASTEGAIIAFKVKEPGYNHSAKVTSGKADCSIDDLGFLHVKHVDADSVITVTYTPKDNYIYIDKYFGNGGIFSKWDGENIKLNG